MQLPCLLGCSVLVVLLSATLAAADEVIVPNNELEGYEDERAKRPFCNAFTGCGKKRSAMPLPLMRALRSDDPMATLLDLNAEPAVAELSRQILSEAKLWEAIQEARDEMGRRHKTVEAQHGLRSFRKRRSPLTPASVGRLYPARLE